MADHEALATLLYEARRDLSPVPPLTETDPSLTVEDAYYIQEALVAKHLADGARVLGYKLGLTSKAMRDMLGVAEPDYAPVLSTMVFDDGTTIDLDHYIQPKAEAEIALILGKPLAGPEVTTDQARDALSGASAAIEFVDSRIADWRITLVDTISDLASSAATVLGTHTVPITDWEPRLCGMVIRHNGEIVATGAGAAAMGDPVSAVAWLANTLAPYGITLEPGQFVMTGSLHAAFSVAEGDEVRADFDRLGSVTMRFGRQL